MNGSESIGWKCAARSAGKTDPPQDCDWPNCGCDPKANEVLEHIHESGVLMVERRHIEVVLEVDRLGGGILGDEVVEALRRALA